MVNPCKCPTSTGAGVPHQEPAQLAPCAEHIQHHGNPHAVLIVFLVGTGSTALGLCLSPPAEVQVPNVTESGYLDIDDKGSRVFFIFYEAQSIAEAGQSRHHSSVPITLWLQGGPGCASLFGAFYELGPELVAEDLSLQPNPGAWNRRSALLFVDQPIGAGFSVPGAGRDIPRDELTLAADLYAALQAFFLARPCLQQRPLVIAGESYAGKYVPSIGHFILQQAARHNASLSLGAPRAIPSPAKTRKLPPALAAARPLLSRPPLFDLRALAIGNGLTDPAVQVTVHADTAYFMGYIDPRQRLRAMTMQLEAVRMIAAGRWEEAHAARGELLEHIRSSAGVATLLDMRRYEDYDAGKLVDCYLNLPEVQAALGVAPGLEFQSCSDAVGEALGGDVMRSVKALLPDLLAAYPLLLYQGMWDAQDGAASSEAWIYGLDWEGREGFAAEQRRIVRAQDLEEGANEAAAAEAGGGGSSRAAALHLGGGSAAAAPGWHTQRQLLQRGSGPPGAALRGKHGGSGERVVAYWKQGGHLTHVVLPDAGHMVPRDAPLAARFMLESWLAEALK